MTDDNKRAQIDYTKLIFWLLGFLAVIMTSIGGSAATHLVTQVDLLSARQSLMEQQISTLTEGKADSERRLRSIESKIDLVTLKQSFQDR